MKRHHRIARPAQYLIVLAAALTACNLVSATNSTDPAADGIQVYSIIVPDSNDNDLNTFTRLLDHACVNQKARTVSAEVGSGELARLRILGLPGQINEAETARIRDFITKGAQHSTPSGLPELQKISDGGSHSACYRNVGQIHTSFDELVTKYPKLVKVQTLGKTWMGTKYKKPGVDASDNSASSWVSLLVKYLPARSIRRTSTDSTT